jgi:hypothetical protein
VVVDELEDHAPAPTGQDVLGRVQLPARARRRVDELWRQAARGLFFGSNRPTPASQRIRARDAVEGPSAQAKIQRRLAHDLSVDDTTPLPELLDELTKRLHQAPGDA